MIKLCLDAGHGHSSRTPGVFDPGAVAAGLREADITLRWAIAGEFLLEPEGIDVFLTRDDNQDQVPVGSRDNLAANAKCNRLISIHCNAGGGTGVEVFYRDAADKAFAAIVLDCLQKATGLRNRGLKHESETRHKRLAVLDFDPPACLIEIGFIDNRVDREKMLSRPVIVKFYELLAERLREG